VLVLVAVELVFTLKEECFRKQRKNFKLKIK